MKDALLSYHIVLTLHNSRASQRMRDLRVHQGQVNFLTLDDEINITKIIRKVVIESNIICYAYNVCRDHVHMIIQCPQEEVVGKVKTIKGKSSYLFNKSKNRKGSFWSQKFYVANLDNWLLANYSGQGIEFGSSYFKNALDYIKSNRVKHGLSQSDELEKIIKTFVQS